MAFPDLAVNAIYTVLCLVPGFITVETMTYLVDVDAELSEFEKSTWSFVASGVTLSVVYFLYVGSMNVLTGRLAVVRTVDIEWVELVAAYPALLGTAVVLGVVGAKLFARTVGPAVAAQRESVQ